MSGLLGRARNLHTKRTFTGGKDKKTNDPLPQPSRLGFARVQHSGEAGLAWPTSAGGSCVLRARDKTEAGIVHTRRPITSPNAGALAGQQSTQWPALSPEFKQPPEFSFKGTSSVSGHTASQNFPLVAPSRAQTQLRGACARRPGWPAAPGGTPGPPAPCTPGSAPAGTGRPCPLGPLPPTHRSVSPVPANRGRVPHTGPARPMLLLLR